MKLLSCCLILVGLAAAAQADAPGPRAGGDTGIVAETASSPKPRRPRAGTPVLASPMTADAPCGRKYCSDAPASEIVAGTTVPAG